MLYKEKRRGRDSYALVLYEGEAKAIESDSSDVSLKVARKEMMYI